MNLPMITACLRRRGSARAYYVSSLTGSDSNDGFSLASAFATLGAARTAADTSGVHNFKLVRGSQWRESLNVAALSNANISDVGDLDDPPPIIKGSDIFAGWTKTGGLTNVYQVSVTHEATGTSRLTVYEDGILLTRVTSDAACDATPGSFVDAKGTDGTPVTVKIHATGSGNPASNSKVYEIAVRNYVILGSTNARATGIQTEQALDNNGAFDFINATNVGASRILSKDGTKHNLAIGDGYAEDCITIRADALTSYEPAASAFVAFMNDGTGKNWRFERCGIVDCVGSDFDAHGSPNDFDSGLIRQCWTVGTIANDRGTSVGRYMVDTDQIPGQYLSMCLVQMDGGSPSVLIGEVADTVIRTTNKAFSTFWRNNAGTMTNCALIGGGANSSWFGTGGTASALTVNRSILYGGTNFIFLQSGSTYVGDYNIFYAEAGPAGMAFDNFAGGFVVGLDNWQTASGGQDSHSVYVLAADQTAGNANALWLGYAEAAGGTDLSTIGPAIGDCRINPTARVYASNGTARTGTFTDGTAITTAGPRNHWDWMQRAQVSGPPLRWPTVPLTLEECQEYTSRPTSWDFYP